jgi:manganese/zinc/iron transport system substrate-binding protein
MPPITRRSLLVTRRSLLAAPLLALPATTKAQDGPPLVLSTIAMIGEPAARIGGAAIRAETLLGEGVVPHLYRPTRADLARLMRADLVLHHGLGLEGRLREAIERAAAAGRATLAVGESLPRDMLLFPEGPAAPPDPHVWMDPALWGMAATAIAAAIARLWPARAAEVQDNLAAFRAEAAALDAYARRVLSTVPPERRVLVTAHDAFGYFGRRYGFEVEGIEGISTESEAGVQRIRALVDLVVSRRIPAVFAETSVPERNLRALIEGAAVRGHRVVLGGRLFSDAMGPPGSYEGTWIGMLDHNVTTIARALGGEAPARGLRGRLAA